MKQSSRSPYTILFPIIALWLLIAALPGFAADVLIIGNTQLKPVTDTIAGIRKTLRTTPSVYLPSATGGILPGIAAREGARVVIALGREAIDEALPLPSQIAVIYDLVILPVRTDRPNTTGLYMATPVGEYASLIRRHLPSLKRVALVTTPEVQRTLGPTTPSPFSVHVAGNSFELVNTIRQIAETDAIMLVPDLSLLTETAMEEIYLHSFRNKIPILGVSEKQVKQGALLALVFDPVHVGRQLGELANEALNGADMRQFPPSPARKFNLYVNSETARKMSIAFPDELLKKAKKVYP